MSKRFACLLTLLLAGCETRAESSAGREQPKPTPAALSEAPAAAAPPEEGPIEPSPAPAADVPCVDAESCTRACDSGNAQACHRVGVMHRDGKGVKVDEAKAHELFERGCFHGSTAACDELGH